MSRIIELASLYVEGNIGIFHDNKLNSLRKITLRSLLKRKNPYLFRAKHLVSSIDVVQALLSAHVSSNEETLFGNWLEGLAIYINQEIYGGDKAHGLGLDLDFTRDGQRYIVAIKSGPNWGNSSSIDNMQKKFKTALTILRTGGSKATAMPVNGCCYGQKNIDCGNYLIRSGQMFWELISGDPDLYLKIIEPLGFKAKENNERYYLEYAKIETAFMEEFIANFCKEDKSVDWEKIVRFNAQYTMRRKSSE